MHSKVILRVIICTLALFIAGCAWWKTKPNPTPEQLFDEAYIDYQKGHYDEAITLFQKLKEEHPLSKVAILAEIGMADSYYYKEEYGEAETAYMEFINLHPANKDIPYVMYQLGMCHYNQMSELDRDQSETLKAKKGFERLIMRFPESKYASMAGKKLIDCKKRLAEHEFYVGRFYFKMKEYKAALKRFENIASNYADVDLDFKVNQFIEEAKKHLAENAPPKEEKKITTPHHPSVFF
jgi:outer membrane protein assembly factor BamD